jgi:predicted aconitase
MKLTASDESILAGGAGQGAALAMRIVVGAGRFRELAGLCR